MKKRAILAAVLLVLVAAPGCTNDEGETEAPVFITVSLELQPGFVDIGSPAPVQVQEIELTSRLKNASQSDPQGFADTQINSYTVRFRRTDGGTRVPLTKTYGAGILVPAQRDALSGAIDLAREMAGP